VEKADKIVVISGGVVEQMGTHEQLLAQEGMYRKLVQRQMIANVEPLPSTLQPTAQPTGPGGDASPGLLHPAHHLDISPQPRSMAQSLLVRSVRFVRYGVLYTLV